MFVCPQVNGTEIEYEFEEITLERVSISAAMLRLRTAFRNVCG